MSLKRELPNIAFTPSPLQPFQASAAESSAQPLVFLPACQQKMYILSLSEPEPLHHPHLPPSYRAAGRGEG